MQRLVGQAPGLRRPLRPPSAGPSVVLGFGGKAGPHGVVLDVPANPAEFFAIANENGRSSRSARMAGRCERAAGWHFWL